MTRRAAAGGQPSPGHPADGPAPIRVATPTSAKSLNFLAAHAGLYALARVMLGAIDIVLLPLYTRLLGPTEYGLVAVGSSVFAALGVLLPIGLDAALMRLFFLAPAGSLGQRRVVGGIVGAVAVAGGIVAVGLTAAGPTPFGAILAGVNRRFFTILVWAAYFNLYAPIWLQLLQMRQRPNLYLVHSLGYATLRGVGTVVAVVTLKRGAEGWAEALLFQAVVSALIALGGIRRHAALGGVRRLLREAVAYGFPLFIHQGAGWLSASAGRLVLNAIAPIAVVGVYQVALSVGQGIGLLTTAVNLAYAPAFMERASRSPEEAGEHFGRIASLYLCALFALTAVLSLCRAPLIALLAPHGFEDAAAVLPIVLGTFAGQGVYFVLASPIFFEKRSVRWLPLVTTVGAAIGLLAMIWLTPLFGLWGAAWAGLLANSAILVLAFPLSQRSLRLQYDYRRLGLTAGGGVAVVLASYAMSGLRGAVVFQLLSAVAYGVAVFVALRRAWLTSSPPSTTPLVRFDEAVP